MKGIEYSIGSKKLRVIGDTELFIENVKLVILSAALGAR